VVEYAILREKNIMNTKKSFTPKTRHRKRYYCVQFHTRCVFVNTEQVDNAPTCPEINQDKK